MRIGKSTRRGSGGLGEQPARLVGRSAIEPPDRGSGCGPAQATLCTDDVRATGRSAQAMKQGRWGYPKGTKALNQHKRVDSSRSGLHLISDNHTARSAHAPQTESPTIGSSLTTLSLIRFTTLHIFRSVLYDAHTITRQSMKRSSSGKHGCRRDWLFCSVWERD